jgi:hypothetical protein
VLGAEIHERQEVRPLRSGDKRGIAVADAMREGRAVDEEIGQGDENDSGGETPSPLV